MSVTVTGFKQQNGLSGEQRVAAGTRDNMEIGELRLTYVAVDGTGNKAQVTRTLLVQDTTAPVLTIRPAVVTLQYGQPHDPWSSFAVTDLYWSKGGEVTSEVKGVPTGLESGFARPGAYTLTFSAFDPSGNAASTPQQIVIQDKLAPVIYTAADHPGPPCTLQAVGSSIGGGTVHVEASKGFNPRSFVAACDTCWGDLTKDITITINGGLVAKRP